MKKYLIILLFLFSKYSLADFDYSAYKQESLNNVVKNLHLSPSAKYEIEGGEFKYQLNVTYTGKHRAISSDSTELISKWVFSQNQPNEYNQLFEFEIEVKERGDIFWLPIQKGLVDAFASEVENNGVVTLFVIFVGAIDRRPIFLINEFKK